MRTEGWNVTNEARMRKVPATLSGVALIGTALLLLICGSMGAAAQAGQSNNGNAPTNGNQKTDQEANPGRGWVASPKIVVPDGEKSEKNVEPANVERRKQITDDTTRLLEMANELKAEVDKTNKDTLSLGVIRKAEEIEKLAHAVKEKMKLTTEVRK